MVVRDPPHRRSAQMAEAMEKLKEEEAALAKHLEAVSKIEEVGDNIPRRIVQIDCPTCGILVSSSEYTSHIESCFEKIQSNLLEGAQPAKV